MFPAFSGYWGTLGADKLIPHCRFRRELSLIYIFGIFPLRGSTASDSAPQMCVSVNLTCFQPTLCSTSLLWFYSDWLPAGVSSTNVTLQAFQFHKCHTGVDALFVPVPDYPMVPLLFLPRQPSASLPLYSTFFFRSLDLFLLLMR